MSNKPLEDNLIGLSYVESVLNEDYDRREDIEEAVSAEDLSKGLMLAAAFAILILSIEMDMPQEEVMAHIRERIIAQTIDPTIG